MGGPRPPRHCGNLGLCRMQQDGVGRRVPCRLCLLKASPVHPCHGSGRCWVFQHVRLAQAGEGRSCPSSTVSAMAVCEVPARASSQSQTGCPGQKAYLYFGGRKNLKTFLQGILTVNGMCEWLTCEVGWLLFHSPSIQLVWKQTHFAGRAAAVLHSESPTII